MSHGLAIFTLIATCVPAWAAAEETPLRRSINLILHMRLQDRVADARIACDSALRLTESQTITEGERATLFTLCGNVCLLSGELANCRPLLETSLGLWKKMLGPSHAQVGAAHLNLAILHRLGGRYELSLQCAREALRIDETSYGADSPMLKDALVSMGIAQVMLGRYADAETDLKRALSLLPRGFALDEPESVSLFSALGLLYFRRGEYFEAELWYRRASATPGSRLDLAKNLANLGGVYLATSSYSKADAACSQALDQLTRLLGPDHPEVASALQALAQVRFAQHRYGEAIELLGRALQITIQKSGPDQLNASALLSRIGVSYALDARYTEAEMTLRKAILIQEKLGTDARGELSVSLHNLAFTCKKQGRNAEALNLESRALSLREGDPPNADSMLLAMMVGKAELLRKVHRKAEATKLEHSLRRAKSERGNEDPHRWMVDFRELQKQK